VDHGIERPAALINAAENGRGNFAEIGQIDADRGANGFGKSLLIDIEHVVAMGHEIAQHGAAKLATATGDEHLFHPNLLIFHADFLRGQARA
jgi:hypothetical protein